MKKLNGFFGRVNDKGDVEVFDDSGERATKMEGFSHIYSINSNFKSVAYENERGIILSMYDAKKIGLKIED